MKTKVIIGPTAIGKTDYAINLAQELGCQIISADSMQVYKHMDIGTAKPTQEDMKGVKHHLIDFINPDDPWNLHLFLRQIKQLQKEDKQRLIVGGTGLYIRALIYNFDTPLLTDASDIRENLKQIADAKGLDILYKELLHVDPESAGRINMNDEYRIIRALEVYKMTGKPISEQQKRDESHAANYELICLNTRRDVLYKKIEQRIDRMMELGLLEEVQKLLDMGYSKDLSSMQALGYKEIVMYFEQLISLEEAVNLIKKRTRNFAKRQLTWYRSFPNVTWIEL